jgi:hypothetical protein
MTADKVLLCLRHLDAAEAVLLEAEDWRSAAHLSIAIDRVRAANGLPERPVDLGVLAGRPPSNRAAG